MPIRREREDEMRFDVYRDGVWYKHTGYAGLFHFESGDTWYGEYEDADGNIEYFN